MYVRSYTWGEASISWSVVMEELLYAAENLGHNVTLLSTNGYAGMKYWTGRKVLEQDIKYRELLKTQQAFDLDITYTVPENFPKRFLNNSKYKMAIYAYESSIMPESWTQHYSLVDYILPPSQYVKDMMLRNGCPEDKIVIVPHGVDLDVFNPNVKPINLEINKTIKFLCVAEPHYRKQLDKLIKVYCKEFSSNDDVCLVLKTKIFNNGDKLRAFEMDLRPTLLEMKKKYGSKMAQIKVVSTRLNNVASLYTACDAFVLMTASEGWGMPFLEALACKLPVVAPRFGGQLQFLNDSNAILTKCGTRLALPQEQYWNANPKATTGNPDESSFALAMRNTYTDLLKIKTKQNLHQDVYQKYENLKNAGLETAMQLTWKNAFKQIASLVK